MVVSVFVLDRRGVAVMPCSEKRARQLLARGRARVHRIVPFVIRLVDVEIKDCALQTPGIEGVEYQQGTLAGYELREYLLDKWGRKCAYCGAEHTPLQIEHIQPRARGGSHRESNLTLACRCCNEKKAALPIEVFLSKKPEVLKRIQAQAQRPLRDAAAVNTTRWALANALKATGLPVELSSGGRTKFNRQTLGIPKTHALDAVCVGELDWVQGWPRPTLQIKCTGRGSYQRTRLNRFGFPRGYLMREKSVYGFTTGDLVKATVTKGKKQGFYRGRVAIREKGNFNIQTAEGVVQGISHKHCTLLQRGDGYGYQQQQSNTDVGRGRAAHDALCLPGMNAEVSRAIQG